MSAARNTAQVDPTAAAGPDDRGDGSSDGGGNGRRDVTVGTADSFGSILFDRGQAPADAGQPAYFSDLNLDQVVDAVVAHKRAYELTPFFHAPLTDPATIRYRQEIFTELERPEVHELAEWFAKRELVFAYQRQRRTLHDDDGGFAHYHYLRAFLNAAVLYCETLEQLTARLAELDLRARGLRELHDYLSGYLHSDTFGVLREQARTLDEELGQVRYSLLLKGSRITVGPYDEQHDYSAQVSATFERFAQEPVEQQEQQQDPRDWETYSGLGVLHLVAKVYPELFQRLDEFCTRHIDYLDRVVAAFDRELQFYLSYLDYIRPLRDAGLAFSYPRMSPDDKSLQALDTFDLALARQRVGQDREVVTNEMRLDGSERILVVTGPNNGGKTTYARTFGQLHYLSRLGCPVPGRETRLFICDEIFTRFERREDSTTLAGKLQDELNRLHEAFETATPSSLFILNEMFNSTTAHDALLLSRAILERVSELDALCMCVTFLDELTTLSPKTVSIVSSIDPADPTVRTFRLVRRPADGRAYARALAEKYGLTYAQLMRGRDA